MSSTFSIPLPPIPRDISPELRDYLSALTKVLKDKQIDDYSSSFIVKLYGVGSHYVQYPSDVTGIDSTDFPTSERPATKFGGTWTQEFNTEGVFFRTEGGKSAEYRNYGLQEDAIRNITGAIIIGTGVWNFLSPSALTAWSWTTRGSTQGTIANDSIDFDASRVVPTGSENRPINRYIKVWRRTA